MKTPLLLLGICVGLYANGQTIELEDSLSIGDMTTYYTLDSNVTSYADVTGSGASWDYSDIGGYGLAGNLSEIVAIGDSEFPGEFPDATYNEDFTNGISTYFSHDPAGNKTIIHGFAFEEAANTFIIKYDVDDFVGLEYPMSLGDSYTDDIEGEAVVPVGDPIDISGTATVSADGSGTLTVGTNVYTNVIRVYTKEVTSGTATIGGTVTFTRESYAYYDIDNYNMPIFLHGSILAELGVLGDRGFTAVYSRDDITGIVGVEENVQSSVELSVYPNPVSGNFTSVTVTEGTDKLTVLNSIGQEISVINNPSTKENLNVAELNRGVYFIQAQKGTSVRTEKLVIK